ncbi:MAG TPA: hypothetical protein VH814_24950 [Steroidobacteraceae bacterium]|jgi:hypothetical protein
MIERLTHYDMLRDRDQPILLLLSDVVRLFDQGLLVVDTLRQR